MLLASIWCFFVDMFVFVFKDEIARLQELASERAELASEAVTALQAPIVTVTRALVDVREKTRLCVCPFFFLFL